MSADLPHERRPHERTLDADPLAGNDAAEERQESAARRPMTLAEAGRRGGEKVKRERGPEFYAEIGRKGGRRVAESHGPSFYAEIGRKGGESRRREAGEPEDS